MTVSGPALIFWDQQHIRSDRFFFSGNLKSGLSSSYSIVIVKLSMKKVNVQYIFHKYYKHRV